MKCKNLTIFLSAIIVLLLGTLIYTNLPESGAIEYGARKTAEDLPRELFVDTYLKRNTIKAGEIMEVIGRMSETKEGERKPNYLRVTVRYIYPNRLDDSTTYAYDFFPEGKTRFTYDNENISIKPLGDGYYSVKFAVPKIPGPYNVQVSDPMQKYEITVVDKMDTKESLSEMLYQYIYTQYNLINQRPLDVTIKELIVGEKYLEVTHSTSFKVCRSIPNSFDAQECTLRYIAGKLFVEPDTGIVRRDDSVFIDNPQEVWKPSPFGQVIPGTPK